MTRLSRTHLLRPSVKRTNPHDGPRSRRDTETYASTSSGSR